VWVLRGFPHAGTSKTCKKYNYYEDIVRKSELLPPMFLSLLEIKMLDRRYKHQDSCRSERASTYNSHFSHDSNSCFRVRAHYNFVWTRPLMER